MTKLLDEELEQDEMFWNQEALKEVAKTDRQTLFCFLLTFSVNVENLYFIISYNIGIQWLYVRF